MSQEERKNPERDERGRFTKGHKIAEEVRFQKENAAACKYKEQYADELIAYFGAPATRIVYDETFDKNGNVVKRVAHVVPNEYPTFEAFAARLGVTRGTLLNWCKQSKRFEHCYARAKEMQRAKLITNTLGGFYNPQFAKFEAMNNHDMKERVENEGSFHVTLSDEVDEESN